MPSKKKKTQTKTAEGGTPSHTVERFTPRASLPYARYISLLGVHLTLTLFSALYLPRSNALLGLSLDYAQTSSLDRPQHEFLAPLTAKPVLTLVWLVVGEVVLQSWWSGWVRKWWVELLEEEKKGDVVLTPAQRTELGKRKLRALKSSIVTTIEISFIFLIVLMLFGAPLASHYTHTCLLATLLAILTVHTPAYTIGTPSFAPDRQSLVARLTWVRLFAAIGPIRPIEQVIVYPSVGAVVGCWVGVIPIALDWDRPWQAWPLTPAYGAIFGQVAGSVCAAVVISWSLLTEMGQIGTGPR